MHGKSRAETVSCFQKEIRVSTLTCPQIQDIWRDKEPAALYGHVNLVRASREQRRDMCTCRGAPSRSPFKSISAMPRMQCIIPLCKSTLPFPSSGQLSALAGMFYELANWVGTTVFLGCSLLPRPSPYFPARSGTRLFGFSDARLPNPGVICCIT